MTNILYTSDLLEIFESENTIRLRLKANIAQDDQRLLRALQMCKLEVDDWEELTLRRVE